MGNPGVKRTESEARMNGKLKRLTDQADNLSYQLSLDAFRSSVMRRIFVQERQKHLIKIIHKLGGKQKVEDFLDQVHSANLQILDSFYEHILRNSFEMNSQQEHIMEKTEVISAFDREIGICGSSNFMKQKNWDMISQKYVSLIDLSRGVGCLSDYQLCKEKGLEAIKNRQASLLYLAGRWQKLAL